MNTESFLTDCITSSESTLTTPGMPLPPTEISSMPLGRQESEKDQDRRRKKAYRCYKHYAKPTKASMCSIVDNCATNTDITRQDVDLLPWNTEETEVIRKVMKALKKRMKTEKKDRKKAKEDKKKKEKDKEDKKKEKEKEDKKKKKKEKKEEDHSGREDTASAKSNGESKRPTLLKGQMGDSSMTLDSSLNNSSGSLYAGLDVSSSSCDQDHTQEYRVSAELLQMIKVEKEHRHRREPRRRKREAAKKKSMLEADMQEKVTEDTTSGSMKDDRRLPVFLRPKRMTTPTPTELKRQVERYRLASMAA
jgi:hypothetical protein